ncbi:hypothetical protein Nepgr_018715 [Nepenthes gracilis]|uniref:Uncharacterized protein n=1 Tax=Nepenthes gracilis TaxID=150966 RepID=A0AAD3XUA4_NEPGR|nr:hypothetical protein Nepgr_018715 [Nepenthes gracilis]
MHGFFEGLGDGLAPSALNVDAGLVPIRLDDRRMQLLSLNDVSEACAGIGATSESVSRVRPSGLSFPPAPNVSRVEAEVPSLAGIDQFYELSELVVADSRLSVGAQHCAIPGNRIAPE